MMTAIVMMKVDFTRVNDIAGELTELKEVSEVYSVGGRFDLVAILRVDNNEDLSKVVTEKMPKIKGIQKTETMVAFRAYSRHDLESMFSVGLSS
jgi:DNA-binding Lrp family transcriptional regulator